MLRVCLPIVIFIKFSMLWDNKLSGKWMSVIKTPLGVGKFVLITGIKYTTVDVRTVF